MKRLGIFITYDKENRIDAYIGYLLKELKTVVSHLVVICNMPEIACGREYIEPYADELFFRENKGFDAGGYQDALCNLIGWERVLEYEELCLINDSFFGPFIPMQNVFAAMEENNCDFWGLLKHGAFRDTQKGIYIKEHIQSFFLAIRPSMLHSEMFISYWKNLPLSKTFSEAIGDFELSFTTYFSECGYTYACLADAETNISAKEENNFNQYWLLSDELMKKRNFPFLKKQHIAVNSLEKRTQEHLHLALDYINNNTDYDIGMVWENLIRLFDISDMQRNLSLQWVLDESSKRTSSVKQAVIVVEVFWESAAEYVLDYMEPLREECNVVIIAATPALKKLYESYGLEKVFGIEEKREVYRLLQQYSYVCVLRDEDMSSDIRSSYHGKTLFFRKWENLVKSKNYVERIVALFEENPYLGLLAVPTANFGEFFSGFGVKWEHMFAEIYEDAKRFGVEQRIRKDKPPFTLFEEFWMRREVLETVEQCGVENGNTLPYLMGYLAQKAGYCSGIVESSEYAAMNEINMQYYLSAIREQIQKQCGSFDNFKQFKALLTESNIKVYCQRYGSVYVYGTGDFANRYSSSIPNIKAYVVSDGRAKPESFKGKAVLYLSEIQKDEDTGMVICVDRQNHQQIIEVLQEKGITDYFCCF